MIAGWHSLLRFLFILLSIFAHLSLGDSFSCLCLKNHKCLPHKPMVAGRLCANKEQQSPRLSSLGGDSSQKSLIGLNQFNDFVSKNFFLCGMVVAIALARAFPGLGKTGGVVRPELFVGKFGVTLVFLLSGLSTELSQITSALVNWKLNLLVNAAIFGFWPFCVGIPMSRMAPASLKDGLLIMSCLPTTVNMCVILTSAGGGNVALALCNAVFSNLIGIFATPALLFRLMGSSSIALPFRNMLVKMSNKVMVPVVLGQLLRLTPLRQFSKHKALKRIQEIILLGILWNAFCTAFSAASTSLALRDVAMLFAILPTVHLLTVAIVYALLSRLGFFGGDVVASVFCASQKTLAFGLPLIHTLFSGCGADKLAAYSAPIMLMHPLQLIIGSLMLPFMQKCAEKGKPRNHSGNDLP